MNHKPVYMLVAELFFATKVVKTAQSMGFEARAFDSAVRLVEAARAKEPGLVIMDCEGLEREAFGLLERFHADEKLKKIPRIGYLSHTARDLKNEMRSAGAFQIYNKAEFSRDLGNILMRHTHDFSSRI